MENEHRTLQGDARKIVVKNYFMRNGFTSLNGKCVANCFDGVFVKGKTVYVVETKPLNANGTINLNGPVKNAGSDETLPRQMSDKWIESRLNELSKGTDQMKQAAVLIKQAIKDEKLVKVVAGVDTKSITIVKLK
jgi:filamentous hemagglutinin